MFEQASKLKLRFSTSVGSITAEDLWDLPLTNGDSSLDNIAKAINRTLKDSEEESFVLKKTGANKLMTLRMDIVKHIISVKLQEIEDNEKRADNKAMEQKLLSALASKEDEELQGLSMAELKKRLKKTTRAA